LSPSDLKNVQLTCRQLRTIALSDTIWQWYCKRDFKATEKNLWPGWTYRNFYAKALSKYGYLFGMWQRDFSPYGGLLFVKMEQDAFVGYDCLPPLDDSYQTDGELLSYIKRLQRDDPPEALHRLRFIPLFAVKPIENEIGVICYQSLPTDLHSPNSCSPHDCSESTHIEHTGNGFEFICNQNDQHPKDMNYWFLREFGFWTSNVNDLMKASQRLAHLDHELSGRNEKFTKFSDAMSNHIFLPLHIQCEDKKNRITITAKPGIYSGMYDAHGWELLNLNYSKDGKFLEAVKVTGDTNIPTTKVSFRVFLTKPLIAQNEFMNLDQLKEALEMCKASDKENALLLPSDDLYPFRLPEHFFCDRPESEIPKYYRRMFAAECQLANREVVDAVYIEFDEDLFGLVWIKFCFFNLHFRAKNLDTE